MHVQVIRAEVIRDDCRWREILPHWNLLSDRCKGITPFQLPEWLLTWWAHFGNGELQVLAAWEDAELLGLVPTFLHTWQGRRQVTLVGSGISDYLEPMILPERKRSVVEAFRSHWEQRYDWDICVWQDLNGDSSLGSLGVAHRETPSSAIAFNGSFDDYWAARGPNLRRNIKRYRKRAESAGPLEFAVSNSADPILLDALIQLHGARWAASGEPGMITANGSGSFLRQAACRFAERGMLRIFTLRFRDDIAAIIMAFEFRGRVYGYLTGFDPAHEEFGFGRLLLFHALRYCFERRCKAWDFLRGEEPYKTEWGAEAIPKSRVVALKNSPVVTSC
jgi:CelD/BcsL family acetyltransferase involved in cellulose biosynthesis